MANLGFGFMRLPLLDNSNRKSVNFDLLNQMVDYFISNGNSYFDTGYFYHNGFSEIALRKSVIERYQRNIVHIADKLPLSLIKKSEQMEEIFQDQLIKCGVNYFNTYLLHAVGENNKHIIEELHPFDFLYEKKKQGKADRIGFSYHGKSYLLEELLSQYPFVDMVQLQINYLDWDDLEIEAEKCHRVAVKHNKKIVVMEPIKGGLLVNVPAAVKELFNKYDDKITPPELALRFAASQSNVETVLSGMQTVEQVVSNDNSLKKKNLSEEELSLLSTARKMIRESISVPCTSCRYCSMKCPQKIKIPELFSVYNNYMMDPVNQRLVASMYYSNIIKSSTNPQECLKCGLCNSICPQRIDICNRLKEANDVLRKIALKALMKYYKKNTKK